MTAFLTRTRRGRREANAIAQHPGGDQIEYADQDPRIHPDWLAEMKKNGAKVDPNMLKYFPEKSAAE